MCKSGKKEEMDRQRKEEERDRQREDQMDRPA